ncbi:PepSY domain-containing protein [Micromonospora inyonensis]|uniref:Peptidase propeptide and YPEB domain-containing protein n=1 Tax=Micromonospora inyonensis TaxID=47866 RepID=A0A1C6RDR7_9ACTN|nr:PepSY domain-containing protein [Micromonospora inyonensis]SCL15292.1 Peptidase propeptide and YPEB domain-containing protein [Micromonospora inyonensis]
MKHKSLITGTLGGAAVLAVAGAVIGTAAAADERSGRTTLTAATTAPTAPATPSGTPATPTAPAATGVPTTSSGGTTTPATGNAVDEKRAGEIALARAGGGRIVEVEAEEEHGRQVWSVEIVNGGTEHEIDVDRTNGSVVKAEQEPVDDDDDRDDDDDDDRDDD